MPPKSTSFKARIVFAATPEFSVGILEALINAGHNIVGVYCQPDRPKGRTRALTSCPVKQSALIHQLNVYQPNSLKDKTVQQNLVRLNADVMVVVAYGQILPKEVLQIPKYGCLNIHASLLPRWRGAAPIQRAIIAGDKQTGVSIMQMDEGLDTGDILLEQACAITHFDTAQALHDKLSILGAKLIVNTLSHINNSTQIIPTIQNKTGATYAKKLKKEEAWIDWTQSAIQINRQIRAFNPYPIAQTHASSDRFDAKVLRIFQASIIHHTHQHSSGNIIECGKNKCYVATADGILSLEKVQLAGKKAVNIKDFANACQLTQLF